MVAQQMLGGRSEPFGIDHTAGVRKRKEQDPTGTDDPKLVWCADRVLNVLQNMIGHDKINRPI